MAFGSSGNRIPGQSKPSVDTMSDESTASEVTAEVVSDYLRDNPDFFNQHPEVLSELKITHVGDGAVSLVERQVATLRERNAELRRRLDALMSVAEQNEALLEALRKLSLLSRSEALTKISPRYFAILLGNASRLSLSPFTGAMQRSVLKLSR